MHWVYILCCNGGRLYTGYTINLAERYQAHCQGGRHCKFTRSFKPQGVVTCWNFGDKRLALKFECFVKTLSHQQKLKACQDINFQREWLLTQLQPASTLNNTSRKAVVADKKGA